ncbi:MAG: PIG-L family deacetylase [Lachnospiraceae bacterium]|nr:PIG-L family deacetylase [Lachnospiraceae bacterium]
MKVLVFAPHRDDEIIGCGGTLLKRKAAGDHITVCLVTAREGDVLPAPTQRIHDEMKRAHAFIGVDEYIGFPFGANKLEEFPRRQFNKAFDDAVRQVQPDEVFLPFWGDMQKDHQMTVEGAMVALRAKYAHAPKRIYAYETLSETGINVPSVHENFLPTVYEDISDYLEGKIKALSMYESQMHPFPDLRSVESVEALARLRGATVNVKAAEAFVLIREIK